MHKSHYCSVSFCLQGTTFSQNFLRDFLRSILHNFGFKWVLIQITHCQCCISCLSQHIKILSCNGTVVWISMGFRVDSPSEYPYYCRFQSSWSLINWGWNIPQPKMAVYKIGFCDSHKSFWVNIGYEPIVVCNQIQIE